MLIIMTIMYNQLRVTSRCVGDKFEVERISAYSPWYDYKCAYRSLRPPSFSPTPLPQSPPPSL